MSEQQKDIIALIAEHIIALDAAWLNPESIIGLASRDLLNIHNITAQSASVIRQQHEQILALTDAIAMMLGRTIEMDRRMIHVDTELHVQTALIQALLPAGIAERASEARALLEVERHKQLAELAAHEQLARDLISTARQDDRKIVTDAAAVQLGVIGEAETQARQDLHDASEQRIEAARDVNAE